ncbi:MAG: DUF362 domain-containing protein [Patescibacteria group bacterium]
MNRVVLLSGHDRRTLVREVLMKLGEEWTKRARDAKTIFIHPNLVNFRRAEANTHTLTIRGVLDHISELRADTVTIGDAGVHNTKKAFETLEYQSLSRSGDIRLLDLNDDETIPSHAYTGRMQKRTIGFSKTVAESDFVIAVVPAKMHNYFGVTLSVKTQVVGSMVVSPNMMGKHMRWPWVLTGITPGSHTLADVFADHPAHLAIIDGVQTMEGDGPADGDMVDTHWLIASFNPVSADALAAYLMGWDPHDIGYLHFLNEKGLGPIDISEMEIDGPDPASLRRDLAKPESYPDMLRWKGAAEIT